MFGPKAKDNEDIRGLLNAGHRRGATSGRCVVRGNDVQLEELPAYAAVALAGIGWLPDTLLSRSVIIRMRRRHAGERVEAFRRRLHEVEGWRLRDVIATWAESVVGDIRWPELPLEITDRDADVWEALLAVADVIGSDWPGRARAAGVALVAEAKEVEPSLGIRLLNDIRSVFGVVGEMSSKSLLRALHEIEEAPWSDLKGKPLDERGLAHRLRQYGLRSKSVRIGTSTPKGYVRADFVDLWTRYLPSPATSATSATSETSATSPQNGPTMLRGACERNQERPDSSSQINDVADVADVALPSGVGRVCAHCDQAGGEFCEASVGGRPIWLHPACMQAYRP